MKREKYIPIPLQQKIWQGSYYTVYRSRRKRGVLKITRTQNHGFYDLENKRQIQCRNHNALLDMMDGALTGKTGFTGGAGYSYVGALEKMENFLSLPC